MKGGTAMTRFISENTAVFAVTEWKDTELNQYFWDIYLNGKFYSRHTSLRSLMSQILKIIHDRSKHAD